MTKTDLRNFIKAMKEECQKHEQCDDCPLLDKGKYEWGAYYPCFFKAYTTIYPEEMEVPEE